MTEVRVIRVDDPMTLFMLAQEWGDGVVIGSERSTFDRALKVGKICCSHHYLTATKSQAILGYNHWYFVRTRDEYDALFVHTAPRPCLYCWRKAHGTFYDPP